MNYYYFKYIFCFESFFVYLCGTNLVKINKQTKYMSDFNKEQLVIFINNLFIVIGSLFTYHTIVTAYDFYLVDDYSNMGINLTFGLSVGTITFWLLFTAIKKSVDELIKAGFPNGFVSEITSQLQFRIDEVDFKIAEKKKELNADDTDTETEINSNDKDETNA